MRGSAGERRELNLRGRLGADEPMSGFNPDAMNGEKSGMASRGMKEERLCGIPQRTEQTLLTRSPKLGRYKTMRAVAKPKH